VSPERNRPYARATEVGARGVATSMRSPGATPRVALDQGVPAFRASPLSILCVLLCALCVSAVNPAFAQETKPQPTPKSPDPTLDELLGLKPAAKPTTDKPSSEKAGDKPLPDATALDLQRKLSPTEAKEKFEEAIALMGDTAERLQKTKDTSLATQRIQEDIIRRLDMVIRQAEQNKQQSKSKSSSKQQQKDPSSQQQQQQQQQNQQRKEDSHNSDSRDNLDPPAARPAELNPELTARGQAWGALPQRVRDALLQGNSDKYSTLYQRWTEQYYRKLAEEGKK